MRQVEHKYSVIQLQSGFNFDYSSCNILYFHHFKQDALLTFVVQKNIYKKDNLII